ncbi:hypothetical protein [Microtetraspora niveoalba]|uniref:hypothetical protein n=1 Tax=Microtetraspora niveoalba TaxID=46175 RepID=UPI0012F8CA4A|nr:hypothetical protein [Microtetraspora niveoalba]
MMYAPMAWRGDGGKPDTARVKRLSKIEIAETINETRVRIRVGISLRPGKGRGAGLSAFGHIIARSALCA